MPKKTAILFIFLAHALLVGHGILAHPHHRGFVWFCPAQISNFFETPENHADGVNHQEDGKEQETACLLTQSYLVPAHSARLTCPRVDLTGPVPDLPAANPNPGSFLFPPFSGIASAIPPLLLRDFSSPVRYGPGFRGPPLT